MTFSRSAVLILALSLSSPAFCAEDGLRVGLRSNLAALNTGYSAEAYVGKKHWNAGVVYTRAKGKTWIDLSDTKPENDNSEVGLKLEISPFGDFTATTFVLSLSAFRNEGSAWSSLKTSVDGEACWVDIQSRGVLFSEKVLAGVQWSPVRFVTLTGLAGFMNVSPTPSYEVELSETNCNSGLTSSDFRKRFVTPAVELNFGFWIGG